MQVKQTSNIHTQKKETLKSFLEKRKKFHQDQCKNYTMKLYNTTVNV